MDRTAIKQLIATQQPEALETERNNLKNTVIHGEWLEIEIKGNTRRLLYYPSSKENAPVYFHIHGGGFCGGLVEHGDQFCHLLCSQYGYTVFSLDYPLAPQAEYPALTEWLYDTILYLYHETVRYPFAREHMAVGGISAGANLAAALTFIAQDRGDFRFKLQVLDCPFLDLCEQIPNEERYQGEYAISPVDLQKMMICYATWDQRKEKYCTPLVATQEELEWLPPAVILTCQWDSLAVEGEAYAQKLICAGVDVAYMCYPGVIHAFTQDVTEDAAKGRKWLADHMRTMMFDESGEKCHEF